MRVTRLAVAAACATATVALAACGSSGDKDTTGAATQKADAAPTSDVVSGAKTLLAAATKGMTYSPTDFPTKPSQVEAYGTWRGPTSAPKIDGSKTIEAIICTKQSAACVQSGQGIAAAGKALGWKVDVIDGGGTPEGFAKAFDTAFARKADAIVNVAVPTLAVGDKLAEAKKKGIVTVVNGDVPPASGEKYDAYVSFRMPFMESLLAYAEIARTDGKANSIVVTDPGFPSLVEAMGQYKKVMATCSGCKTTSASWQITDASDPTKVQAIISGALAKNPNATSITLPYAIGLPAVAQALQSAGKADQIKILVKDGDTVGLQGVKDGSVLYSSGASPTWAGWAAVDQAIRGIAKQPYLAPDKIGIGLATFDKTNVPADGNIDTWSGMPDFSAEYQKAWGVS